MMDDRNPFLPAAALPASEGPAAPAEDPAAPAVSRPSPTPPAAPALSPAVAKFKSCRWRADPEAGEFCTHRDVLPFAGKTSFNADSWCPECSFYKLRRTPKKRERADYTY
jgi:hypothetical protein